MEPPETQVEPGVADARRWNAGRVVDLGDEVRSGTQGGGTVEVTRQLADVLAARRIVLRLVEEDDARRLPLQHLAALEREHARAR
jgi:hypothetical protein